MIDSYGTVNATAKAIRRSEGALRKWLKGLAEPTASDLRALCELTSTSANWLLFGQEKPALPPRVETPGAKETAEYRTGSAKAL